jgi:hypothetical protein
MLKKLVLPKRGEERKIKPQSTLGSAKLKTGIEFTETV